MLPDRPLATTHRSSQAAHRFATSAAIGFAGTLVLTVLALSSGIVPRLGLGTAEVVDPSVLLLFVPLCALVLAVVAEVLRGLADHPAGALGAEKRPAQWRPGHGEG